MSRSSPLRPQGARDPSGGARGATPRRGPPSPGTGPSRRRPTASRGPRAAGAGCARSARRRPVEDHGDGVGVVPQVGQLVIGVAVVGVDRDEAGLDGGVHDSRYSGAVVQVEGHLVLVGRRGRAASGPPVGPAVELAPVRWRSPWTRRAASGWASADGLPDVGVVPVGRHGPAPRSPWRRADTAIRRAAYAAPVDLGLPADDDPRPSARCGHGWRDHPRPSGRQLAEAGYVAPHWPAPWGRGADPVGQLVIDEELRRGRGASPGQPDRHRVGRTHPPLCRHRRAEGAVALADALGGGVLVPALQRARRRLGPGRAVAPGPCATATTGWSPARRSGRASPTWRSGGSCWPAPTRRRQSTRASPTSSARWTRRASRSGR